MKPGVWAAIPGQSGHYFPPTGAAGPRKPVCGKASYRLNRYGEQLKQTTPLCGQCLRFGAPMPMNVRR